MMPSMDGYVFMRTLKALKVIDQEQMIPVVIGVVSAIVTLLIPRLVGIVRKTDNKVDDAILDLFISQSAQFQKALDSQPKKASK